MGIFKRKITATSHTMGPIIINRVMPQKTVTPVGSFVFLDYINQVISNEQISRPDGSLAHPHRGISTLTYLMKGEVTHIDSYGHQGKVSSGGVQWMKSGSGIVHDEWAKPINNKLVGLQFWINLTAKNKFDSPDYLAVQNNELPTHALSHKGSYVKIIVGEYKGMNSPISTDSRQLLLHLDIVSGEEVNIELKSSDEYAIFVANGSVAVDGDTLNAKEQGYIFSNTDRINLLAKENVNLFIYGGEKYLDPIVSHGPFVMSSQAEIINAYQDYHSGVFGEIDYKQINL